MCSPARREPTLDLSLRETDRGNSLGLAGKGQLTCEDQGPRTKDKATKDQGLYHNYRFLGDHIPGGGIDLRASGCAPCVCLPLTLLYSYSHG